MFVESDLRERNSLMSQSAIMSGVVVSNRPLQNMNCILQAQSGMGALFLGDVVSTLKESVLEAHRVKAILTCMAQNHHLNRNAIAHKVIPIKDTLQYPISLHFDEAALWIEAKRAEGLNVLVHCHAGVSRSATIVTAYLMRFRKWSAVQALNFVRSKRERAKPNLNFWSQLTHYEQRILQNKEEQKNKLLQTPSKGVQETQEKESPTRQYRKRRIFETPPISENHARHKIVVSTECLPPSHHARYSQSITFNSQHPSDLPEGATTYHSRILTQNIQLSQSKILTPQPNWRPQITLSQPTTHSVISQRGGVSAFEVGNMQVQ